MPSLFVRLAVPGALLLAVGAAQAQEGAPKESSAIKKTANAATSPIDGKEVPAKLQAILDDPYSLAGLKGCAALEREVDELNAVLGPDANEKALPQSKAKKREDMATRVASNAAAEAIPFGGLIGEVTGANAERRRYAAAIYAGTVRRGFLKGVGQERGCKAPARP